LAGVPSALAVHRLAKRYGSVEALKGVDLEVAEGELVGLLGPNGAGKSTLVKIAVGLVRPTAGTAEVAGARAGSRPARAALGYLAELFRFPGWYTADEVLELHQQLAGSRGGAAERTRLLQLVALEDAAKRRVDGMSKGMQQRLGIAQALVGGRACSTRRADLGPPVPSGGAPSVSSSRSCAATAFRPSQLAPARDRARLRPGRDPARESSSRQARRRVAPARREPRRTRR
jgi:ABC-type transport system involved in cytochrome c biogenesis ATPase subunit